LLSVNRPIIWFCALGILLGAADILSQPCLFVRAAGDIVAILPAQPGTPFSIHFIHSVQKTPVLENLAVDADGRSLVLHSTKYQSFGVGLPFLAEEGYFYQEGDYYILDGMERHFPQLTLRTGVGTQLTLYLGGRIYRLFETYPPGTPVDLFVDSLGKGMLR
jgi:hypothetical protein